jgi:DNA helicase-2/ATP-dependent DNA helicase PcrA
VGSPTASVLHDLSDEQRVAAAAPVAPMAIWAGAGSGKTRVLTRRIAHRVADGSAQERHIVAVTFTRKAAEELRTRLHSLIGNADIVAGTFHAIAYAQLRQWHADHDKIMPSLVSSRRSFVKRNLSQYAERIDFDVAIPIIDWARARAIAVDEFHAQLVIRNTPLLPREIPVMAELYGAYQTEKRKRHVVDFDDLLLQTAHLFRSDKDFAEAQRWRFRHFFVDEVQDINPSQIALLQAWLGGRDDLCVVGDANQAIYGWNGADSSYLRDFANHYKDANVVQLRDNYRSTSNILSFAHAALEIADTTHHAVRGAGSDPTLTPYKSDSEEVQQVVNAIDEARASGLMFTDIAVLARTNAQLEPFAHELRRRGYPVRLRTNSREAQNKLRKIVNIWKDESPELTPMAALAQWSDQNDNEESISMAQQLEELVAEYAAIDPGGTTATFAEWLTVATSTDDTREPGIDLLTFHKAKGLEWHTVFTVGLENGFVPINSGDVDEERRLLYVALTRATDVLHTSYAKERKFGSQIASREASPFLVRASASKLETAEASDWRDALATARAKLRTR